MALPSSVLAQETGVYTNSDGIVLAEWYTLLPSSVQSAYGNFETSMALAEDEIYSSIMLKDQASTTTTSSVWTRTTLPVIQTSSYTATSPSTTPYTPVTVIPTHSTTSPLAMPFTPVTVVATQSRTSTSVASYTPSSGSGNLAAEIPTTIFVALLLGGFSVLLVLI